MRAGQGETEGCLHLNRISRYEHEFCGRCGKGMSEGAPDWIRPELAPGYAERVAENKAKREREEKAARKRESTYDLSGVHLDWGITGLDDGELRRLHDSCAREIKHRAKK